MNFLQELIKINEATVLMTGASKAARAADIEQSDQEYAQVQKWKSKYKTMSVEELVVELAELRKQHSEKIANSKIDFTLSNKIRAAETILKAAGRKIKVAEAKSSRGAEYDIMLPSSISNRNKYDQGMIKGIGQSFIASLKNSDDFNLTNVKQVSGKVITFASKDDNSDGSQNEKTDKLSRTFNAFCKDYVAKNN